MSGHRVRVPVPLLYSRRHSPTAVAAYGLVDMLTGRGRAGRPYDYGRAWTAGRLGVQVRTLADALRALSVAHSGDGLGQTHPVYLTTRRRGWRLTAQREVTPVVPFVEVPAWTLGDADGPLVSHRAWRLYAALLDKRLSDGTCRLAAGQLAELVGVRRQTVAVLLTELVDAGLVVMVASAGRPAVVVPLTVQTTTEERAELVAELAGGWSSDRPSGGPLTASRGGPLTASRNRKSHLRSHTEEGTGGAPPRSLDPAGLAAAPPADRLRVVVRHGDAPPWCGRCNHPQRRREVDDDTGHLTGRPCPRCSPDADAVRAAA